MTTWSKLGTGLLAVGAIVAVALAVFGSPAGKANIDATCLAQGYAVECTFTNTGSRTGTACVTAVITNKATQAQAESSLVCSGDVPPQGSNTAKGFFVDRAAVERSIEGGSTLSVVEHPK